MAMMAALTTRSSQRAMARSLPPKNTLPMSNPTSVIAKTLLSTSSGMVVDNARSASGFLLSAAFVSANGGLARRRPRHRPSMCICAASIEWRQWIRSWPRLGASSLNGVMIDEVYVSEARGIVSMSGVR